MARIDNRTERNGEAERPTARSVAGPVLVAVAAVVATLATIAPETGGPGITCDEWINVFHGKRLVAALRHQGASFFTPGNIRENFPWRPGGPPFHPPLSHWVLGLTHHVFDPQPDDRWVVSVVAGRFAAPLALGLLVLLVGLWTTRREGAAAGNVAASAVVLVPRVFGHGHLAGLDTFTALAFVAALLAVAEAEGRGGRVWQYALAGAVWGLALMTRLHGVLLLPPVALWLLWRRRHRAVPPLLVWGAAGAATLFAGWPWLWLAPIGNFRQFLGTATGRQAIHGFYAGRVWADHETPWHYPLVMFVVALPLGLLLLGLLGAWSRRRLGQGDPGYFLVMGALAFVLLVFSWPGTPVYDGTRLFLMVFPLWAVSVGIGARWLVEHAAWGRVPRGVRLAAVGIFVALQGVGLVTYHPCQLSHYSLLVGGLRGADRLGFEVNYWGDGVTESLLSEAASRSPGGAVLFGPSLADFQLLGVGSSSPALVDRNVTLIGWDASWARPPGALRYAVLYRRKADLPGLPEEIRSAKVIAEHRKQGVWLARLVELPPGWGRDATVGSAAE